jgi:ABC-type nitrate/sulfonate/bicarbonate transport system permease component
LSGDDAVSRVAEREPVSLASATRPAPLRWRRSAPAGEPRRSSVYLIRAGVVLGLLVAWQLVSRAGDGVFVASPADTIDKLVSLAGGPLWGPMWRSNTALLIGFPAASLLGVAVGSVLARRQRVDGAFGFYVDALMVVPTISVVPVIVVAFGLTLTARVFVVMLFVAPVVALTTRGAVRTVNEALIEMARSYGATGWQVWKTVTLPAVLGPLASGLRVALAHGISGMIVIELVLVPVGIGGLLKNARASFDAPTLYAITVAIVLEGFILVGLAALGEARLKRHLSEGGR